MPLDIARKPSTCAMPGRGRGIWLSGREDPCGRVNAPSAARIATVHGAGASTVLTGGCP